MNGDELLKPYGDEFDNINTHNMREDFFEEDNEQKAVNNSKWIPPTARDKKNARYKKKGGQGCSARK